MADAKLGDEILAVLTYEWQSTEEIYEKHFALRYSWLQVRNKFARLAWESKIEKKSSKGAERWYRRRS